MKKVWICAILFFAVFWTTRVFAEIFASYDYERNYSSYWSLADKASRLDQKADYINQFANKLESSRMAGTYNALWLQTPDNSFDKNLEALKSLQSRMEEIRGMDVKSFEYQQAISQITAQEQGEARNMLAVFEGCWYLQNHFWLWEWVDVLITIIGIVATIVSVIGLVVVLSDAY